MRKSQLIIILIILLSFTIGIYLYPQMPEMMASHWNAQGVVDGYMTKCSSLFFVPLISVFLFLLFVLIPKIDPLKENIKKFRKYYDGFVLLIILFFFYIYLLTIYWNLGYKFNMVVFLMPAFSVLFYYCGVLIENAQRNWFIGIRTPWTLSSDSVWDKTHKLGGKLFKVNGLLALLGLFFQEWAFLLVIVLAISNAIYLVLYSYFEYQKELTKKN
jgi:uncharacterized membrane protein